MNAVHNILRAVFFSCPGNAFLAAAAISSKSWLLGLTMLGVALFAIVCAGIANLIPSFDDERGTLGMLRRNNQRLEIQSGWQALFALTRQSDFNAPTTYTTSFFRSHVRLSERSLDRTLVYKRVFTSPPFDSVLRAYGSTVGLSFVFVLESPDQHSSPYGRFKFFHEMGHVAAHVKFALFHAWRVALVYSFSAILIASLGRQNWFTWLTSAFLLFLAWFAIQSRRTLFEQRADWYALTCLQTAGEVAEVIDRCELAWNINGRPSTGDHWLRLQYMRKFFKALRDRRPEDMPVLPWHMGPDPLSRLGAWLCAGVVGALSVVNLGYGFVFFMLVLSIALQMTLGMYCLRRALLAQAEIENSVSRLHSANN